MKNLFYFLLFVVMIAFSSCGGGSTSSSSNSGSNSSSNSDSNSNSSSSSNSNSSSNSSSLPTNNVDYQMLGNAAELKKVYDAVLEKLGENVRFIDEINIQVARPSLEGTIIRQGNPDEFSIRLSYLYPQDKNKLFQQRYSNKNKWDAGEARGIRLISGDVETFRLEDEVFDMSPLTAEILSKIVTDALGKYKDDGKYSYQYVKWINIKDGIVKVQIHGKLSANDIEKSEYYYANWKGVQTDSRGRVKK